MQISYIVAEEEDNSKDDKKGSENHPPATTYNPVLSITAPVIPATSKPDAKHLEDTSPGTPLLLTPNLATVVPYELWPYSFEQDPIIHFSSYLTDKTRTQSTDVDKTTTTTTTTTTTPSTVDDNDVAPLQLRYYTTPAATASAYTRSAYEVDDPSDFSQAPPPSYSTLIPGHSYSYFVFGSSPEEQTFTQRPSSFYDTGSTVNSFSHNDGGNFDIPSPVDHSTSSPRPTSYVKFSAFDGESRSIPFSKPSYSSHQEFSGPEQIEPTLEIPRPSKLESYSSSAQKDESTYLSFPGPPYGDKLTPTSSTKSPATKVQSPTEGVGFIPPPPRSPSYFNPSPYNKPPASIYDEIIKVSNPSSQDAPLENKQPKEQHNFERKPNTPENWSNSFGGFGESPPKLIENEVLSFIKSYSERPFDKPSSSSKSPGLTSSTFRPPSTPPSKPAAQPSLKPSQIPRPVAPALPALPPSRQNVGPSVSTKQPALVFNTYGSTLKPPVIEAPKASSPPTRQPVKVTQTIPNSNAISKPNSADSPKPTPVHSSNKIVAARPVHTAPSSNQLAAPGIQKPLPAPQNPRLSPKPQQSNQQARPAGIPLAKQAVPLSPLSVFLKPPTSNKPIQHQSTNPSKGAGASLTRNPTPVGSKTPALATLPSTAPQSLLRGSNTPVYSTAARLAAYHTRPGPVAVLSPRPVYLGPAAGTFNPAAFRTPYSGAISRPIHVVFSYG